MPAGKRGRRGSGKKTQKVFDLLGRATAFRLVNKGLETRGALAHHGARVVSSPSSLIALAGKIISSRTKKPANMETLRMIPSERKKLGEEAWVFKNLAIFFRRSYGEHERALESAQGELEYRKQHAGKRTAAFSKISDPILKGIIAHAEVGLVFTKSIGTGFSAIGQAFGTELPRVAGEELSPENIAGIYTAIEKHLARTHAVFEREKSGLINRGIDYKKFLRTAAMGIVYTVNANGDAILLRVE